MAARSSSIQAYDSRGWDWVGRVSSPASSSPVSSSFSLVSWLLLTLSIFLILLLELEPYLIKRGWDGRSIRSTLLVSKCGIPALLHITMTSTGRENAFLLPRYNTLHSEMVYTLTFIQMPCIIHATTKARGKVTSLRLHDGRIKFVTKCSHLLASSDKLALVIPSVVAPVDSVLVCRLH